MTANRAWIKRNLGFDPLTTPAPSATFAFAHGAKPRSDEDIQREIIDFDSEAPAGREFLAFTTATGLSRFVDISWPSKSLAPITGPAPRGRADGPLPKADVLVVTWTVDEGHALSRVLTPGKDSRNDYVPYTKNFAAISSKMRKGCPALNANRLGAYWTTSIGGKKVVVFKSESHLSQDTKKLPGPNGTFPNEDVWKQIIEDVQPKLVITTGTAGGIGKECQVGDVVVSPIVRWDCKKWLKSEPYHDADYQDGAVKTKYLAQTKKLFQANAAQLPKDNTRPPKVVRASAVSSAILTTDFFGFDTSNEFYGLQGLGAVSEMGDAVLGRVAGAMGATAPRWAAVRNVSDPQIKSEGTLKQQAQAAALIYKGFGRWSTVCSAIVCWALIAPE
jgi:purine-nucleoside phosphorylase